MRGSEDISKDFMVHCVGGCSGGEWKNLRGTRPSQVLCGLCYSDRIAIWHNRQCVYAYNGRVDYPMGDTPYGTEVKGGMKP